MTCIVGLVQDGVVYMGGDSAGVGGYSLSQRGDQKVFTNAGYIFGFTSSFRMGQLLRYRFVPPPCHTWDLERHMATDFVDGVRECFKEHAYGEWVNSEQQGGTFLVGTQGRLFVVQSDFQVGWNVAPYNAVGCGDDLALGALYATEGLGWEPVKRVETALRAAEAYSAGVRGPFTVISLPAV